MMEIKPFSLNDLEGFELKIPFEDLKLNMALNLRNPDRTMLSLIRDNKLVAILGVNSIRSGVGELWLIPGKLVDKYRFEFFKSVHNLIYGYVFPRLGYHRLEFGIDADWPKGLKWAAKLGFIAEGLVEQYTKGKDHILFKKVVY
jgi:RimJ/RimL family protein N-acetyltransferase